MNEEIANQISQDDFNLTNHRPTDEGIAKIEEIRAAGKEYAAHIRRLTPAGREQSLAITNLEQAQFWANASIARTDTDDLKAEK